MNMKHYSKRAIAMLLSIVMLFGMLPATAFAASTTSDETIYILAGGDFQETGDHANSAENVRQLLAPIAEKYSTMDGFLFVGDYDCDTHNDATQTSTGIDALMSAVQETYSNLNHDNTILVQGNHDTMDSRIDATSGHDFDGYSVFVMNEDDYPDSGGTETQAKTLASKMEAWLNAKLEENFDDPIFITSHLPLAFGPRTNRNGDGKYAKYIFDVLNEAAANGLNIFFLHGHDHAYGYDNYLGGEAIYLAKGDKINIAQVGSTTAWTEETLNFSYMNAGYVGYYNESGFSGSGGQDKLTMTVFAITDKTVTVERYSTAGLYNMKSAGRLTGDYIGNVALTANTTVYESPQTIKLTSSFVSEDATIGNWVGITQDPPADDVSTENKGIVTIVDPTLTDDVTTSTEGWVEIIAPVPGTEATPGSTTYQYTLDTDGVNNDLGYLIVGSGDAMAMGNGSLTAVDTTISGSNATMSSQDYEWTITSDGKITNGTYWLAASIDWRGGSVSVTTNESDAYSWTISHSGNGAYQITGEYSGLWTTTYYLRYSNNAFSITFSSNTVRLYGYDQTITTPGTEATEGTNGTYGKIVGDLTYNATVGMTADEAMALVKAGIDGYYYEAMSTPGSDVEGTKVDDSLLTWEWVDTFDGNTAGDYEVAIKYGDFLLGTAEVVVSVEGLYAKVDGTLTTTVTTGTSAEDALAALKAGITGTSSADSGLAEPTTDITNDLAYTWIDTYDPATAGDYAVEISYQGKVLATAEVVVENPSDTTYYIAEGAGLYVVDMNTSSADAMAAVQAGITVYSAADENGTGKTEISDENVTWKWVDTYDGVNVGPYTVEILYDGASLGTVEVKVNVQYDTYITEGWTSVGASEGTYTYTLDTDGIEYGADHKYLIAGYLSSNTDGGYDYILTANGSNTGALKVDISGNTLTIDTREHEWYFVQDLVTQSGNYDKFITQDGGTWLYHTNSSMYVGNGSDAHRGYWSAAHRGNGVYRFADQDGSTWYLRYSQSGNKFTVKNSTSSNDVDVRLYKYTSSTPGTEQFVKLEGQTIYYVANGSSSTKAMSLVKEGITGYISKNADGTDATVLSDNALTWTWKNKFNGNVDGSYWVDISYNGVLLGTVEVIVEPGVVDNYPEYPKEGAVKVNKTATGIDFQASGIAQVEISASGVPSKMGVDVVVVVDTSSSMTNNKIGDMTRLQVLQESMEDMIDYFNIPDAEGNIADIDVAIMDFNGYGTEYANLYGDETGAEWSNTDYGKVYTGDGTFASAGAFVDCTELVNFDVASQISTTHSGTNYDGGLRRAYYLLQAKAEASAQNDEVRDQYVIFLSDGAPFGWNGIIESDGGTNEARSYYWWNQLLQGTYPSLAELSAAANAEHGITLNTRFEFLYNGNGTTHPNRWAEAIKGNPTEFYTVLDTVAGTEAVESDLDQVPGMGATIYSIGFGLAEDSRTTNNFTGAVTVDTMNELLQTIASENLSGSDYYWSVNSSEELSGAFASIVGDIQYAATNARFVDQMGGSFNLQMTPSTYTLADGTENTIYPDIQIISYDIYQKSQVGTTVNGVTVTEDMVGKRIGTSSVLETVKFSYTVTDGTDATGAAIKVYTLTGAYSNLIDVDKDGIYGWTTNADGTVTYDTGDNILGNGQNGFVEGVIYTQTFIYNTTDKGVAVDGVEIPTSINADNTTAGSTNVLPSETFYWKMGTVQTSELAMRYYVYLDGSMEGTKAAGSYATNEFATLYYDNYLGNPCYKDTVSPVVAWKSAKVSYAFYLVNDKGEIIVNKTTGATGTFANKIALTSPVVYDEILLNNLDNVPSLEIMAISEDVLPDYYTLYDESAKYTVVVRSNTAGQWDIVYNPNIDGDGDGVADGVQSTYVTDFNLEDSSAYSNEASTDSTDYDYTHTTVWFAVKWSVEAHPDTVVVDYGLPVDISVLSNDMFGDHGHLEAVGAYTEGLEDIVAGSTIASGFDDSYIGTYGNAEIDVTSGKVRYTPGTMDWASEGDGYEKFMYAVNYTGTTNSGYYYDTITVIPATTVYYEDDFTDVSGESYITYNRYDNNGTASDATDDVVSGAWQAEGTPKTDATQAEDRPGRFSLSGVDANNVYGYDGAYANMNTNSMGSAMKVHVDANSYATAEFSFYGTGLDIIAMTTSNTGTLVMQILDANGSMVQDGDGNWTAYTVDTYYGYKYENGQWVADATDGALYQVPVLKVEGLPYGKYTVKLTASYFANFDHTAADGYDLYLDAVRIYDPAGTEYGTEEGDDVIDPVIQDAYIMDGEGWPTYQELRTLIISAADFDAANDGVQEGIIFIDNTADDPYDGTIGDIKYTISDYTSYGPNNELYLAKGQSVTFELDLSQYIVNGKNIVSDVQVGIKSADSQNAVANLKVYSSVTSVNKTASTSTSMYYSIKDMLDLGTDVNEENQDAKTLIILQNNGDGILSITDIKITLNEAPAAAVEPTSVFTWSRGTGDQAVMMLSAASAPETATPETDIPEEMEPEVTVPEGDSTEDTTTPETTIPEEAEPEVTVPEEESTEDNTTPETTVPEETYPEDGSENEIVTEVVERIKKAIDWLKGWFGW